MDKKRFKKLDKDIAKLDFMIPDAMTMTRYEFIEKYVDDKYGCSSI